MGKQAAMEHHKLVLPEFMNEQGNLFGGYLLKWIDEFAYVTVSVEFPDHRFVTVALDDVTFRHPIACGQILRFVVTRARIGSSSVDYDVRVFGQDPPHAPELVLFATRITFVNIDENGNKAAIRER
jgi:acyl-CoA hydrolase